MRHRELKELALELAFFNSKMEQERGYIGSIRGTFHELCVQKPHITIIHPPLARTQSHGPTELQRRLGNVI